MHGADPKTIRYYEAIKEKRDNPTFKTLHDLNHEMRDRWHDLKKGRER